MQAVRRVWELARLRYRKQLQPEFWIGRDKPGIPLACPQICDRAESAVAEAEIRLKFDGPVVAGQVQEKCGDRAPGQRSILLRRRRSESE